VTGTVWWAIIGEAISTESEPQNSQAGTYLDAQQRYQLLEPLLLPLNSANTTEVEVKVLDCQPFQVSPLTAGANSMIATSIPVIAKTYLSLQSQLHQIPAIHDAWQQEGSQVVLIEDRSDWSKLIDLWHDRQITSLQMLHWLYEISQLWAALEPWHCRQSLLELSNLRVDEDQKLGLQRLYAELDVAEKPLTLQDLGQVWKRLFQESQRTQFGSLVQLLDDLQIGSIQIIDDLQSRLKAIANELQVIIPSTLTFNPQIRILFCN
jgi:protein phosphatase